MPASALQWFAVFGFGAIAVLFVTELWRWGRLGAVIGRRQRILRVCLILSIEVLFAMTYLGPIITRRGDRLIELLYWTLCLLIGLGVVGLALADVREVVKSYARMCRQTFADIDRSIQRKK